MSCFLVLFAALFRLLLMFATELGFRPKRSQVIRIKSLAFLCVGAPSQKKVFEPFFCEGVLGHGHFCQ